MKGIGWVAAGKLLAAKRPRLLPILDAKVQDFLQPKQGYFWAVDVRRVGRLKTVPTGPSNDGTSPPTHN